MTPTTSRVTGAPSHRWALVVGLLLSVGVAGCGGGGSSDADAAAPKATPSRLSFPTVDAELAPGTYTAPVDESTAVGYSITFPAGWDVQGGNEYATHGDAPGGVGILPFLVDQIYTDACLGDRGGVTMVGPRPHDLVDAGQQFIKTLQASSAAPPAAPATEG